MNDENTIAHSPISGFGSKYRACCEFGLHEFIPKLSSHRQVYVEPFCGSSVMFFNVSTKLAILNDKDNLIFNFWNVLLNKTNELEKEIEYTWPGKVWFDKYKHRTDDIGKAVFFYICNKTGRSGLISDKFVYKYNIVPFVKKFDFWKRKMDEMRSFSIWNLDFHDLYKKFLGKGGKDTGFVFYVDPPYINQGKAYREKMTEKDHVDLAKFHNEMKDDTNMHILISYDDCEKIRRLYDGWYIKEVTWTTVAVTRHPNEYHELLISNRKLVRNANRKMSIF